LDFPLGWNDSWSWSKDRTAKAALYRHNKTRYTATAYKRGL